MNTINVLQLNLIHKTKGLKLHLGWGQNFVPKKNTVPPGSPRKKINSRLLIVLKIISEFYRPTQPYLWQI